MGAGAIEGDYVIGSTIGRSSGPSGIAVVAVTPQSKLHVCLLERFARTIFAEVVARLKSIAEGFEQAPRLIVDLSAIGRPILSAIRDASIEADLHAVAVTGSSDLAGCDLHRRISRAELVTTLSALFQEGRLKVSKGLALARALEAELREFHAEAPSSLDPFGTRRDPPTPWPFRSPWPAGQPRGWRTKTGWPGPTWKLVISALMKGPSPLGTFSW